MANAAFSVRNTQRIGKPDKTRWNSITGSLTDYNGAQRHTEFFSFQKVTVWSLSGDSRNSADELARSKTMSESGGETVPLMDRPKWPAFGGRSRIADEQRKRSAPKSQTQMLSLRGRLEFRLNRFELRTNQTDSRCGQLFIGRPLNADRSFSDSEFQRERVGFCQFKISSCATQPPIHRLQLQRATP